MGRPKNKTRDRYPGGKLQSGIAPGLVRRIMDLAKREAVDKRLGSEVGRLSLTGVITSRQADAALQFAMAMAAADRLKGIPRRSPASPSYQQGYGAEPAGRADDEILEALHQGHANDVPPDTTLREVARTNDKLRAIQKAEKRYKSAVDALSAKGPTVLRVVRTVAIDDKSVETGLHKDLRDGLDALALCFWGKQ